MAQSPVVVTLEQPQFDMMLSYKAEVNLSIMCIFSLATLPEQTISRLLIHLTLIYFSMS